MLKWIYLVYGILAYAVFFLTFIYSVLFVGNIYIPYPIDAASDASIISSIIINCILLSIFATLVHLPIDEKPLIREETA